MEPGRKLSSKKYLERTNNIMKNQFYYMHLPIQQVIGLSDSLDELRSNNENKITILSSI